MILCRMPLNWYAMSREERVVLGHMHNHVDAALPTSLPQKECEDAVEHLQQRGYVITERCGGELLNATVSMTGYCLMLEVDAAESKCLSDYLWHFVKTGMEWPTTQIVFVAGETA